MSAIPAILSALGVSIQASRHLAQPRAPLEPQIDLAVAAGVGRSLATFALRHRQKWGRKDLTKSDIDALVAAEEKRRRKLAKKR